MIDFKTHLTEVSKRKLVDYVGSAVTSHGQARSDLVGEPTAKEPFKKGVNRAVGINIAARKLGGKYVRVPATEEAQLSTSKRDLVKQHLTHDAKYHTLELEGKGKTKKAKQEYKTSMGIEHKIDKLSEAKQYALQEIADYLFEAKKKPQMVSVASLTPVPRSEIKTRTRWFNNPEGSPKHRAGIKRMERSVAKGHKIVGDWLKHNPDYKALFSGMEDEGAAQKMNKGMHYDDVLNQMPDPHLKEGAPPGREAQVRELKKKFPKRSAFKIAWASYNKSH